MAGMRMLGRVKLVQLQPSGLSNKPPSGHVYDASRRMEVDRLLIMPKGSGSATTEGEHVFDIDHPEKDCTEDEENTQWMALPARISSLNACRRGS